MTQLVREFSAIGPCITLGQFVKRTEKFTVFRAWQGGSCFADTETRVSSSKVHTEPCRSCRDHEATQYPHGYMD
jgi:hypothetical protein